MLPGFSASSSLYRGVRVYGVYGLPTTDASELTEYEALVIPANGATHGSWCADARCSVGFSCCQEVTDGGIPFANCVDFQADPSNCGGCYNQCRSGVCCNGRCIAQTDSACGCPPHACAAGHRCCYVNDGGGFVRRCVPVLDNAENCGSCGHRCETGQACCNGVCCDSRCCNGACCSHFGKCVDGRCCFPEAVIAEAAAILCLLTLGSDCNAIYQQLQSQVCP